MEDEVNLGGFYIDVSKTLSHLRQDLRDDWFPDFINYDDFLTFDNIIEAIKSNLDANCGRYEPGFSSIFNIPKSNFSVRYSIESNIIDRFVYQASASFLMKHLDGYLSKRVLSYRLDTSDSSEREKYLIRHKIEQWKIFEGITKYSLEQGNALLVTDILNYYENISVSDVEAALYHLLKSCNAKGNMKVELRCATDTLVRCLKSWSYNGEVGLPQNRDASSFISNVVMCSIDEAMVLHGYEYFRYVDDIRIVCSDKYHARKALKVLICELRKLGLNVNSKKTAIIEEQDSQEFRDSFSSENETIERIDSMFRSRSKFVIARSLPLIAAYCKELIDSQSTQQRGFRFCIERLEKLQRCDNFNLGGEYFNQIAADVIEALSEHAVTSDRFVSFLMSCKLNEANKEKLIAFMLDRNKAIYSWQSFLLWRLFALQEIHDVRLRDLATQVIHNPEYSPEANSALIYLAKNHHTTLSPDLLRSLEFNKCFLYQRAMLIALHETDTKDIASEIHTFIVSAAKNTGRRIAASRYRGVYISPLPTFNFKEIYDQLPKYE
ncbi:RNA-directed DNA polymerase [Pseudomonas lini]